MAGLFAGVVIFSCEIIYCGVNSDLLVGEFGPCNCSIIGRGSYCVLSCFYWCQGGEFRRENAW